VFSVKPLFKRFERFEKSLYDFLKANWYNMKNRMLCGKQKFHAIHALPMPAFFVCTVSVKKLKFVSDFLLLSHNNIIQKNIRKSVKTATKKPERMSSQILKKYVKKSFYYIYYLSEISAVGSDSGRLRMRRTVCGPERVISPVRNCPDEQIFIYI